MLGNNKFGIGLLGVGGNCKSYVAKTLAMVTGIGIPPGYLPLRRARLDEIGTGILEIALWDLATTSLPSRQVSGINMGSLVIMVTNDGLDETSHTRIHADISRHNMKLNSTTNIHKITLLFLRR